MKIKLLSFLLLTGAALSSCKKDKTFQDVANKSIDEISAPSTFTWSGSKDVNLSIGITDARFQTRIHVIKIYSADPAKGGELLSKGSATLVTPFNTRVFIASTIKEVYLEKVAPDGTIVAQTLNLTSDNVSASIGEKSITQTISSVPSNRMNVPGALSVVNLVAPETSPSCSGTQITASSFDMSSGNTYSISNANQEVSVNNENGGTLIICATGVVVKDMTLNSNINLIVTAGASVTFRNFQWSNGGVFKNFGTATVNEYFFNIPSAGSLLNQGTMTINQDVDAAGAISNTGTLTINGKLKNRSNGNILNDGTLKVTGEVTAEANITNAGPFTIGGKLITEKNFTNNASGVVKISGSSSALQNNTVFTNSGEVTFYAGNVTISNSFSNSGTVKFTGGEVNFNNNPTVSNSGIFDAETSKLNATGPFTNSGSVTVRELQHNSGNSSIANSCKFIVKQNAIIDKPISNSSYFDVVGDINLNSNGVITLANNAMFHVGTASNLRAHINGPVSGNRALFKVDGHVDDGTLSNGGTTIFYNKVDFCTNGSQTLPAGLYSNGAAAGCGTVIPITQCNPEGNNYVVSLPDADNDGVADAEDDYPNDPAKVHKNITNDYAHYGLTVAFEDSWPLKGDYDLNDVVIAYRYEIATNKDNKVVQVKADYRLLASGGSFRNGTGIQFNLPAGAAKNFSSPSGATLESGQDSVVVVLFTNSREQQITWNTQIGEPTSPVKEYSFTFDLVDGPTIASFGIGNYNPFIWNNSPGFGRGYETHLFGKKPTKLANTSLFGTGDDATGAGRYYGTAANLPWAIEVPISDFKYPVERTPITSAYLQFSNWAIHGGAQSADWYSNTGGSYRDASKLYGTN